MGMKENELIKKHFKRLDESTQRRFRANSGVAWAGKAVRGADIFKYLSRFGPSKCMLLVNPRPFKGMLDGFPDTFGWDTIEITPDMVGQRVAVFVGDEMKATGRLSPLQKKFGELLVRMGGVFNVIRD